MLYSKDLLPELATGDATRARRLARHRPQAAVRARNQGGRRPAADVPATADAHRRRARRVRRRLGPGDDRRRARRNRRRDRRRVRPRSRTRKSSPIDEDTCEALGRRTSTKSTKRWEFELPEDGDYDTIGGFVFSRVGPRAAPPANRSCGRTRSASPCWKPPAAASTASASNASPPPAAKARSLLDERIGDADDRGCSG